MKNATPTVGDLMTRRLLAVGPETASAAAIEMMLAHRITGAPVIDPDGYPIGMISLTDLVDGARAGAETFGFATYYAIHDGEILGRGSGLPVKGDRVRGRMSAEVMTISAQAPIREAAEIMIFNHVHRLLVVDGDRMLGILSSLDLARGLTGLDRDTTAAA